MKSRPRHLGGEFQNRGSARAATAGATDIAAYRSFFGHRRMPTWPCGWARDGMLADYCNAGLLTMRHSIKPLLRLCLMLGAAVGYRRCASPEEVAKLNLELPLAFLGRRELRVPPWMNPNRPNVAVPSMVSPPQRQGSVLNGPTEGVGPPLSMLPARRRVGVS